jgi:hypothetical protein
MGKSMVSGFDFPAATNPVIYEIIGQLCSHRFLKKKKQSSQNRCFVI